jgi:hypothetical protein
MPKKVMITRKVEIFPTPRDDKVLRRWCGLTTVDDIPEETSICIMEPYDHIDAVKYIRCSSIPKPYETVLERDIQ